MSLAKGLIGAGVLAGVFALSLVPAAEASFILGSSGVATSPGVRLGELTLSNSYIGWTTPAPGPWTPVQSGGIWRLTIDYLGLPSPGATAQILGGSWLLNTGGGARRQGGVTDGSLVWPETATADIGCGPGVTVMTATLNSEDGDGKFTGCVDEVRAGRGAGPRIWGSLELP